MQTFFKQSLTMAPKKNSSPTITAGSKQIPKSSAASSVVPAPKVSPISKFSKGKAVTIPSGLSNQKDNRHILYVEGLKPGFIILWLKKHNKDEEPYLREDYKIFEDHQEKLEELGIHVVLDCRGDNGVTALQQGKNFSYKWKQFTAVVGEEDNTPETRKEIAKNLIAYLNVNLKNPVLYKFKYQVRFGGDLTYSPMRPLDAVMVDSDVIEFMNASYENFTLTQLTKHNEVMKKFWTNIEDGRNKMENHI